MGIPACLWRRTGEIYKGNREFAELVGVDDYMLRDVSFFVLTCSLLHGQSSQTVFCISESVSYQITLLIGTNLHLRAPSRGVCSQLLGGAFFYILRLSRTEYETEIWTSRLRLDTKGCSYLMCPSIQTEHQLHILRIRDTYLSQEFREQVEHERSERKGRRRVRQLLLLLHYPPRYGWHPQYDRRKFYQVLILYDTYKSLNTPLVPLILF